LAERDGLSDCFERLGLIAALHFGYDRPGQGGSWLKWRVAMVSVVRKSQEESHAWPSVADLSTYPARRAFQCGSPFHVLTLNHLGRGGSVFEHGMMMVTRSERRT